MGCHGPEGHDGKEPRHEKKERLTTSSREIMRRILPKNFG